MSSLYQTHPELLEKNPPKTMQDMIECRIKTHGHFKNHAPISQKLKDIIRGTPGWDKLQPIQKEALDMLVHKIARILNGNPDLVEHWEDIEGYSFLVKEYLEDTETKLP